jgi:hypothetical protein
VRNSRVFRSGILLNFTVALFLCFPAKAEPAFPPEQTWIFMAGLLEWEDAETFESFPQANRQDEELIAFFQNAGVPASQIRQYRDREATLSKLRRGLAEFLKGIPEDGVLLFYYCGHGYEEGDGAAFAAWDASRAGGWGMDEVVETIRSGFRGRRALLLADCCHSGALVKSVQNIGGHTRGGSPIAAVSSSSARETSTGDWTFTESFLDSLQGRAWADLGADGTVTIADFSALALEEMAAFQSQHVSSIIPDSWTPEAILASVGKAQKGRVGERIQARVDGDWWKGRILEEQNGKFLVRFVGYFQGDDLWVSASDIKPLAAPKRYPAGTKVEVQWEGDWWPAKVLEEKGGSHLIRYDGYGSEWDEWAPPERLRPAGP